RACPGVRVDDTDFFLLVGYQCHAERVGLLIRPDAEAVSLQPFEYIQLLAVSIGAHHPVGHYRLSRVESAVLDLRVVVDHIAVDAAFDYKKWNLRVPHRGGRSGRGYRQAPCGQKRSAQPEDSPWGQFSIPSASTCADGGS